MIRNKKAYNERRARKQERRRRRGERGRRRTEYEKKAKKKDKARKHRDYLRKTWDKRKDEILEKSGAKNIRYGKKKSWTKKVFGKVKKILGK